MMQDLAPFVTAGTDPRDRRIAELEAENTRLRAELSCLRAEGRRKTKKSAYDARRNALRAQGRWHPYVPAGPVRVHVQNVMFVAGMSRAQFAAAANIDEGTLSKILYAGARRVKTEVAAKIRAVTTTTPIPDLGYVEAAGASRRFQALAVAGWSIALIAQRLGMDEGNARKIRDGDRARVSAATARRVRALYDDLWNAPPPESAKAERIAAAKTRSFAAKQGWVPAGAWDDDQIDDPAAMPADGWKRAPERKNRKLDVLIAEAEELFGFGLDRDAAAERLGVSRAALNKALERAATRTRQAIVPPHRGDGIPATSTGRAAGPAVSANAAQRPDPRLAVVP